MIYNIFVVLALIRLKDKIKVAYDFAYENESLSALKLFAILHF